MEYWFYEMHTPNVKLGIRIKEEIAHIKSRYQDIYLFDTYEYGKLLVIDGTVQTTLKDEFIYHEMIVHPPLLTHPEPRRILIIGGGDGGAVREVLKHSPQEVHVVEIDEKVVELSRRYLPELSRSYEDTRVHLHIQNGVEFIKSNDGFDVIIIDSTDPVGPAAGLFEREFYRNVKNSLSPGGIVTQQCGTPFYHPEELCGVKNALESVFRYVKIYLAYIPTYPSGMWSFVMASDEPIERRREKNFSTKYYNDDIYSSSMVLPNFIKEYCENHKKE